MQRWRSLVSEGGRKGGRERGREKLSVKDKWDTTIILYALAIIN